MIYNLWQPCLSMLRERRQLYDKLHWSTATLHQQQKPLCKKDTVPCLTMLRKKTTAPSCSTSSRTETFVQELHVDPSQDKHTIVKNSWQWHTLEGTLILENRVPTCGGSAVLDSRRRSRMKGNLRRRPQKVIRGEEGIRRKRLRLKIQQRIEEDEEEAEQERKYRQIPKADQKRTGEAKKR